MLGLEVRSFVIGISDAFVCLSCSWVKKTLRHVVICAVAALEQLRCVDSSRFRGRFD
jgi:hypothetical protein